MAYQQLGDTRVVGGGENSFAANRVFTRFCTMGFVSSQKWNDTYMVIQDGYVRLYDSETTYRSNPTNYVLEIFLERKMEASKITAKNYSKNPSKPVELHCFYIEVNNGMWAATRLIKIASSDLATVQNFIKCIKYATRA